MKGHRVSRHSHLFDQWAQGNASVIPDLVAHTAMLLYRETAEEGKHLGPTSQAIGQTLAIVRRLLARGPDQLLDASQGFLGGNKEGRDEKQWRFFLLAIFYFIVSSSRTGGTGHREVELLVELLWTPVRRRLRGHSATPRHLRNAFGSVLARPSFTNHLTTIIDRFESLVPLIVYVETATRFEMERQSLRTPEPLPDDLESLRPDERLNARTRALVLSESEELLVDELFEELAPLLLRAFASGVFHVSVLVLILGGLSYREYKHHAWRCLKDDELGWFESWIFVVALRALVGRPDARPTIESALVDHALYTRLVELRSIADEVLDEPRDYILGIAQAIADAQHESPGKVAFGFLVRFASGVVWQVLRGVLEASGVTRTWPRGDPLAAIDAIRTFAVQAKTRGQLTAADARAVVEYALKELTTEEHWVRCVRA